MYKVRLSEMEDSTFLLVGPCLTPDNERPAQTTIPNSNDPNFFSHKIIKFLNGWMSSFIWTGRKPHLKISTLCLPSSEGGLDLPDIRKYQLSAHMRAVANWVESPASLWLDIEVSMSKLPLKKNCCFWKNVKTWNCLAVTHFQSSLLRHGKLFKNFYNFNFFFFNFKCEIPFFSLVLNNDYFFLYLTD